MIDNKFAPSPAVYTKVNVTDTPSFTIVARVSVNHLYGSCIASIQSILIARSDKWPCRICENLTK